MRSFRRAKLLVFFTSADSPPLVRSLTVTTRNSSVKVWDLPADSKRPFEEVRASSLIWLEGNSRLKKSLADREKSVNLAMQLI